MKGMEIVTKVEVVGAIKEDVYTEEDNDK